MLVAHLARCPECAAYEADIVAVSTELRAAPLERLEHPIVIRRPRRVFAARVQIGVAAAFAVAVLGALTQVTAGDTEPAFASPVRFDTSSELTREVNRIIADGHAFAQYSGPTMPL